MRELCKGEYWEQVSLYLWVQCIYSWKWQFLNIWITPICVSAGLSRDRLYYTLVKRSAQWQVQLVLWTIFFFFIFDEILSQSKFGIVHTQEFLNGTKKPPYFQSLSCWGYYTYLYKSAILITLLHEKFFSDKERERARIIVNKTYFIFN